MSAGDRPPGGPPSDGQHGRPDHYYFGPYDQPAVQPAQVQELPVAAAPSDQPRRSPGRGSIVAVAALTALIIGGAAGYGGSRLSGLTLPGSSASASPSASQPAESRPPTPVRRTTAPASTPIDAVAVAKSALPSTVMIRVGAAGRGSVGSGFVFDKSGLILTNNHVVADAADGARMWVFFADGSRRRASIVGRTAGYDLAVIKVKPPRAMAVMPIGDSDALRVGESVLAIGAPLALAGTVTEGIISATERPVSVGDADKAEAYINSVQTDAPINPGNSGGPLVDAGGRVIGINSAILTLSENRRQAGNIGLGFAIPINQAMEIAGMLVEDGKVRYPVIGAEVADPTNFVGVRLTRVDRKGPLGAKGLRKGDKVLAVNGVSVNTVEELIVEIREYRPKDTVLIKYKRGKTTKTARVTLGGREG
jgi:putative serine protease PepD